ncbi:hypothetical protein HU200_043371 [Digitaria exilis]|uniref:Uncharacterized protein n=1 Tax=Digitaria exilis TaxID=1010633 RepID=A0A835EGC2_9POAL|nr:hypothetical protein HU200_043371 [Digitaria exilis]CAB3471489.1 unnamed protein product [Digitaria exilis]
MAPTFGRSISFPLSPARSSKPRAAAYHVRSISLPCRAHPLLTHLHTHTAAARAWSSTTSPSSGLAVIDALLAALAEVLLLPEAQSAVHSSDRLLDAFLVLADAHRGFHESLLALRSDGADVRAALRRRDAARLASAARSQRRTEKDLARLAGAVSSVAVAGKCGGARQLALVSGATAEESEMAAALVDAAAAAAVASAAVFSAAASVSAAVVSSSKKAPTFAAAFGTKKEAADVAPEKLDELDKCIDECETGSEVVFRSIVRTRVSLLNIRTPAI